MMVTLLWTAGMNWFTTIDIVHNHIETDDVDDDHRGNHGASDDNDDDQDHNDLDDAEEG